jgi:Ca2+-binding EF-hand superfamily protein
MDDDGSGEIEAEEFFVAMTQLGKDGITLDKAKELIASVDDNGSGTLNFPEFVRLMTDGDIMV